MGKKKALPIIIEDAAPELLASAIVDVANSAKKLLNSGLERRAILVLIKDMTSVPLQTIEQVLDAASRLDRYVKRKAPGV